MICLSKLPAMGLGCYGQLRLPTPNFDELATRAVVCERYYRSPSSPSLLNQLSDLTPDRLLLHDSSLATHSPSWSADCVIEWECWPNRVAIDSGLQPEPSLGSAPGLVVLLPSIPEPSDESLEEVRLAWEPEFEDASSEETSGLLTADDRRLRQAALMLEWEKRLPAWLQVLGPHDNENELRIITSLDGSLDADPEEHDDWVRSVCEPVVHLPLLLQHPAVPSGRLREFVTAESLLQLMRLCLSEESTDMAATIQQWQNELTDSSVQYDSPLAHAVRTENWLFIERRHPPESAGEIADPAQDEEEPEVRLYRKPEDVWESMDLASQYPDVLDSFASS